MKFIDFVPNVLVSTTINTFAFAGYAADGYSLADAFVITVLHAQRHLGRRVACERSTFPRS